LIEKLRQSSIFEIEKYHPGLEKEWELFLTDSANGTIFHSQRFFRYHPASRFKHHHLLFYLRGKLRALFTAAEIESKQGLELHSHPGASYGGFVLRKGNDFEDYYGLAGALLDYANSKGFKAIQLTQTPVIYYQPPQQGIDYALLEHGFGLYITELTQSVDLDSIGEEPLSFLVDKTRNACRQAEKKGLVYEEGVELSRDNLSDFHRILVENRQTLGVTPTHTLEELISLSALIPEHLHLAFIEHKGKRIAGLLHFVCNKKVLLLFYVCHLREYQDLKPAPYLLYRTLSWAKSQGFKELDLGISTVKGVPTKGLLKFKENFRAHPYLRNTYRIEL
jgi:hypothetical protein